MDGEGIIAPATAGGLARRLGGWAAGRELSPAGATGISLSLGLLAAVWYSKGTQAASAGGSALLCAGFLAGMVAQRLAAGTRREAVAGRLRAASSMTTECAVYASLVVAATAVNVRRAWELAIAAMALLAARRLAELCYDDAAGTGGQQPGGSAAGRPVTQILRGTALLATLPDGERTLLIAVTAPLWGARVTFPALLGWGAVAAGYSLTGRMLAFRGLQGIPYSLVACRDDGPLARWLGRLMHGQLPPLLPVITGVTVTVVLTLTGLGNLPGVLVLTPAVAMLLAALGSGHPHTGSADWLVPPLLLAGELTYITGLGFAAGVPAALTFLLASVIALGHVDIARLGRVAPGELAGAEPPARVVAALGGLGWEGRMLVAGAGALIGAETLAYIVAAGYLWLLFGWRLLTGSLADSHAVLPVAEGDPRAGRPPGS